MREERKKCSRLHIRKGREVARGRGGCPPGLDPHLECALVHMVFVQVHVRVIGLETHDQQRWVRVQRFFVSLGVGVRQKCRGFACDRV